MPQAWLFGGGLLPLARQVWWHECVGCQAPEGVGSGKCTPQKAADRRDAGKQGDERGLEKKMVCASTLRDLVRIIGMSPVPIATSRPRIAIAHSRKRSSLSPETSPLRRRQDLSKAAGKLVNHKRVDRLYAEQACRQKRRRKKIPLSERHPLERPTAANQVWSMDFLFDRTEKLVLMQCCQGVVSKMWIEMLW